MRVVSFQVGGARFALPADVVSEVVEAGPINQHVPGVAGQPLGLTRVRGSWIPVIELSRLLDDVASPSIDSENAVLLLLEGEQGQVGLRVQDYGEVALARRRAMRQTRGPAELIELNGELVRFLDPAALRLGTVGRSQSKGGVMNERLAGPEPAKAVVFRLGDDEFGLDVMQVVEVIHLPEVRTVPGAPEFVEGLATLRPSVVPIIDMRKRFSLSVNETGLPPRLLVVEMGKAHVGLVVDSVPGVIPLTDDSVSLAPELFRGLARRFLKGIARIENRLIILLDIERILDTEERIALERVIDAAAGADGGGGD
jgi:purine-binding chemotaxis protein CheW